MHYLISNSGWRSAVFCLWNVYFECQAIINQHTGTPICLDIASSWWKFPRQITLRAHRSLPRDLMGRSLYIYIYIYIYNNYTSFIFFLQLFLSFQFSSVNPFSPISPLIPSAQISLGLPCFLLPGGHHFILSFGSLPSSILWTCPYHWSCLVLISSKRDLTIFIFLIIVFLIWSFLEIRAELLQKWVMISQKTGSEVFEWYSCCFFNFT